MHESARWAVEGLDLSETDRAQWGMVRPWLARIALAGLSLTLALVAAERIVGWMMPTCAQDLYETDERLGWALVPGLRTVYAPCSQPWSTIRTTVETNELGLRDVERAYEKPPGVFRVLVLGDSFTEALQVERGEAYVARLEELLNERLEGATAAGIERIEVLNAGVSGYGTDNELLAFRERHAGLGADLVLLAMSSENDIYENRRAFLEEGPLPYPDKPYFVLDGDGTPSLHNQPVPRYEPPPRSYRVALEDFVRSTALYRTATGAPPPLKRRNVRMLGGRGRSGNLLMIQHYLEDDGAAWREARALTGALIDLLAREVEASGGRFAVVVLPDKRALHPELLDFMLARNDLLDEPHRATGPYEKLVAVVEERRVPSRGLLPALRDLHARTGHTGFLADNSHFSAEGHDAVARAIADFFADEDLVPGGVSRAPPPPAPPGDRSHPAPR